MMNNLHFYSVMFYKFIYLSFFFLFFQIVFEEHQWSLGIGVELRLDGRQHLRENIEPGGKTHNVTSTVRAKTQRNKDVRSNYYDTKGNWSGPLCARLCWINFHSFVSYTVGSDLKWVLIVLNLVVSSVLYPHECFV